MIDVNYIFFYHCYIDENNKLLSIKKIKYNLQVENELSSNELINIIYNNKKQLKYKTQVFSIVVHNNYEDPIQYLENPSDTNYLYATNGLKNIIFEKTDPHFSDLNNIHIFYKQTSIIDTKTKKVNFNVKKRKQTKRNLYFEKEIL